MKNKFLLIISLLLPLNLYAIEEKKDFFEKIEIGESRENVLKKLEKYGSFQDIMQNPFSDKVVYDRFFKSENSQNDYIEVYYNPLNEKVAGVVYQKTFNFTGNTKDRINFPKQQEFYKYAEENIYKNKESVFVSPKVISNSSIILYSIPSKNKKILTSDFLNTTMQRFWLNRQLYGTKKDNYNKYTPEQKEYLRYHFEKLYPFNDKESGFENSDIFSYEYNKVNYIDQISYQDIKYKNNTLKSKNLCFDFFEGYDIDFNYKQHIYPNIQTQFKFFLTPNAFNYRILFTPFGKNSIEQYKLMKENKNTKVLPFRENLISREGCSLSNTLESHSIEHNNSKYLDYIFYSKFDFEIFREGIGVRNQEGKVIYNNGKTTNKEHSEFYKEQYKKYYETDFKKMVMPEKFRDKKENNNIGIKLFSEENSIILSGEE